MSAGCVEEVDLFLAFRQELAPERSTVVLRHIAGCALCHEQWKRFLVEEEVAEGIQCALRGDAAGADAYSGWNPAAELPDPLHIPGFRIQPGFIEGGQARVYRGVYEASGEEVAIKVFHEAAINEAANERFAREIKSLARLRHPNVVTIRSDGQVDGHAYFVMPWIDGLPLDEYVVQHPLSVQEKVGLVSKICDAVSHAHLRGVMHLDLKPSNVRVDATGEPIVMDFGLAKLSGVDLAEPPSLMRGVAGTPLYMAPEQLEGNEDLDVRADVYSLGLLLYEVLVGKRAKGADLTRTQRPSLERAREVPPPPRTVDPQLPSELEAITLRATEVDRERRYQTARALYEDLQNYAQGRLVKAKAHEHWYRLRKWVHMYRQALMSIGLVLFIIAFAVAVRMYGNWDFATRMKGLEPANQETRNRAAKRERDNFVLRRNLVRELVDTLSKLEATARLLGDEELADKTAVRLHDCNDQFRPLLGKKPTKSSEDTMLDDAETEAPGDAEPLEP